MIQELTVDNRDAAALLTRMIPYVLCIYMIPNQVEIEPFRKHGWQREGFGKA